MGDVCQSTCQQQIEVDNASESTFYCKESEYGGCNEQGSNEFDYLLEFELDSMPQSQQEQLDYSQQEYITIDTTSSQ